MKRLLYILLLSASAASGQVKDKDSIQLRIDLSLTGFWQGGNVETLIFRAAHKIDYQFAKNVKFRSQNSYVLQEFGRSKADEDILSLNFLNINTHKRLSPLALAFFSTNYRRQIDYRYILGGGMSYEVLKKKKHKINMSLTGEFEHTEFQTTDFKIDDYDGFTAINTWRSTLWFQGEHHLFSNKMILKHEFYFQPSLQECDNFRWRGDISLEFPVWDFLNFKMNYYRTYESVVVAPQLQEDEFLTFGFTIKNYK